MQIDWANLNSQMAVASGDEQGVRWSVVATAGGVIMLNVGGTEQYTHSESAHLVPTMNVAEGLIREAVERRLQVPKIVVRDFSDMKTTLKMHIKTDDRVSVVRQQMPTDTIYVSDDKDFEYALFAGDRAGAERLAAILALCPPTNCAVSSKTIHTSVRATWGSVGKTVLVAEMQQIDAFNVALVVRCAKTKKTLFSLSMIGCTAAGMDRLVAALFLLLTEDRFAQTRKDLNLG